MTSEQDIRADFDRYTDSIGLLTEWENPKQHSGNGLRFTAEKLQLFRLLGFATAWKDFVDYSWSVGQCRVRAGLYNHAPGDANQISHDDMTAIAWASPISAVSMISVGSELRWLFGFIPMFWVFNNRMDKTTKEVDGSTNWRALFFWRRAFICHLYNCAWPVYKRPRWYDRAFWCFALAFSGKPEEQDPWILNSFLAERGRDLNFVGQWAARRFNERFEKAYPNGRGELYEKYFQNKDNPLAKHWPARK